MATIGFIGGKFLPLHNGHVYAITQAACMCDKLYLVLSYSVERDKQICKDDGFPYIPYNIRLRWLSQLAKDMENVEVISVEDFALNNDDYDWGNGASLIKDKIGQKIDFVFSSEPSYDNVFKKLYPESKHIVMDSKRSFYSISATKIRKDGAYKHWDYLPKIVRPYFVKSVVVVGTESCGKSTLVRYLGKIFNTSFVEEYGRTLCKELGGCDGVLIEEDYNRIVYEHKVLEHQAKQKANKIVFIDTEANITDYYSNLYLNNSSKAARAIAQIQKYDLWLYLEPDVNWVDDGLRVHGEQRIRERNNIYLKQFLDKQGIKYYTIKGTYHERINRAIELIEELL